VIAGNVLFAFSLPTPAAQSMAGRPLSVKTVAKPKAPAPLQSSTVSAR
jgi:hypothetical protein